MQIFIDACCLGRRKTGNETYTRGLLRGLDELAAPELDISVLTTVHHTGVRQARFQWTDIPLGNFISRNFLALPRLLNSARPNLFHAMYWARWWKQVPYVVMVHDISFVSFPQGFKTHERLVYANLVRQVALHARRVLTVSEFSRHDIHGHWGIPLDRISVTYDGLDDCFNAPVTKPAQSEPPYILYVGNLHPRKNLVRLLESFVRLKAETKTETKLKIVGQKAWLFEEIFETLRRHKLENDVTFTGYVSQDELVRLYQNATVTAYPSLFEGFGLPVLEAMACGSPVVTSKTTSIPEVAGDACVLVDPESVEDIARGLAEVLASAPLQQTLRERGLLQARKFTWRDCAAQTVAAYQLAG
jgi:glycosyltransferase involved in cell wall biosynthesis